AGFRQQLVPARELHSRPAERLAEPSLVLVDRLPAPVLDEVHAAVDEEVLQLAALPLEQAGCGVLEQPLARLGGVLLVRADDAARPALHPAGGVDARAAVDAALDVRDHAAPLVERDVGKRDAAIADAAKHEPARDDFRWVGRLGPDLAVLAGDEPVADDLDRLDAALAEDLHRRDAEAQRQPLRLSGRRPRRELA